MLTLPLMANLSERGCMQSTSRSALKNSGASEQFQRAGLANRLRLVFDTAALRGHGAKAHDLERASVKSLNPTATSDSGKETKATAPIGGADFVATVD